ncbi:hypothetical protein M0R45_019067 [Rubus argutus]|uniref:Uncharacterized protein n=1 Tax=Rubus argutus TaxID=59490 RepID=A0AAW1X653_RUBAR
MKTMSHGAKQELPELPEGCKATKYRLRVLEMRAGCPPFQGISSQPQNPTPFGASSFRLRRTRSCPSHQHQSWLPDPRRRFTSLSATTPSSSTREEW